MIGLPCMCSEDLKWQTTVFLWYLAGLLWENGGCFLRAVMSLYNCSRSCASTLNSKPNIFPLAVDLHQGCPPGSQHVGSLLCSMQMMWFG